MSSKQILFSFFLLVHFVCSAGDVAVTSYGAVGDGHTVNTAAIQKAIDACSRGGGGKVMFPKGTWVSGTILLKDNVHLFLEADAILLGSTDIADYAIVEEFKDGRGASMGYSFIGAKDAKNTGIGGKGKINGNGKLLLEKNGRGKRPFLVRFVRCTNVAISDVHMEGPAAWTVHFFECKKVTVAGVVIRSRGLSNNDGIDIDCSEDVVIKDCDIDSGDDAICLKATGPLPCRNIEVYNCKINTSQGAFKLGTESVGNFENINIHHCTVENTKGIKLYSVDGSHLKNLKISDITIEKTTLPLLIRLGARLKTFREGDMKKPVGVIDGINIKNIKVKQASQMAILISGIPGHSVANIQIADVTVRLPGNGTVAQAQVQLPEVESDYPEVTMFGKDMPAYGVYVRHAKNVYINNLVIQLDSADARPALIGIDVQKVKFHKWQLPATASAEAFFQLEAAVDVLLKGVNTPSKPLNFLQVDSASRAIVLHADKPTVLAKKGALKKGAVTIMKPVK